jgi:cobalt-precorrin 5A hydrolase
MDGEKVMIAIGIGCRNGASKEAIMGIVAEALAHTAQAVETAALFTYEGKRHEAGLIAAANALAMPLHFLPLETLQSVADRIVTPSQAAEKALGIPSVAEAAALAGCGQGAHLLVPRITGEGVTCAIAKGIDE